MADPGSLEKDALGRRLGRHPRASDGPMAHAPVKCSGEGLATKDSFAKHDLNDVPALTPTPLERLGKRRGP